MTRLSKPVATIETLKRLVSNSDSKYATKDSLSTVATTGNYSDLKGTPTSLKNPNAISFTGGSTASYDGSKGVTVAIPTSLPANGGNASTVNGHTVLSNVPANAKFTDTVYSLPDATATAKGGVKVGSNITVDTGTISLTADNVTGALGYTPPTHDTHYATGLKVGATAYATSNAAATNGNVYLNVLDNYTVRDSHKIVGTGATTVTSDANGVITISSTDTNTVYTHPNSGVTAGTYKSVTVNAQGHVTSGTNPTTLSGYGITDAKIANGVITLGANSITPLTSHQSLANYYTKGEVNSQISSIPKFAIAVVTDLPTGNISDTTIYLKKTGSDTQNLYTEYIYVDGKWEQLGTQKLDLSGYLTKTDASNTYLGMYATAVSANKLSTSAGSATNPVYFYNGVPVATTYTLGKSVPSDAKFTDTVYYHPSTHPASMITGLSTVATSGSYTDLSDRPTLGSAASKDVRNSTTLGTIGWTNNATSAEVVPTINTLAYWNGAFSGTTSNLAYCAKGAFGSIVTKNAGDYAAASHSHYYAGSSSVGGAATSANKLNTNAGSSTTPTYFYNGVPVACTGISVATVTATTTLNIPGGKIWIE